MSQTRINHAKSIIHAKKKIISALRYAALLLIIFYLLFPFLWTLITSLKTLQEVFLWPPTFLPREWSVEGYINSLFRSPVPLYVLNSIIYSLSTAAVVIVIATITTYGLSMYPYRGSNKILVSFFFTRVIPTQILWLPLIVMYQRLGLMDSRLGLIIFLIALSYPLCVWMLKGLFDAFPRELMDSAALDGCTRMSSLFKVVMPVLAPGVAAIGMVSFLWAWSNFMFAFLLINTNELKPVTVGVYYFVGDEGIEWNSLAATEMMVVLPGIIFFFLAQRHIVRGLTAGASKS